ncbi:MAG TPA: hypothetical protein VNG31_05630 [Candidatus Baltobacteraceae bacterium]|nr:hypothetical protein [Candidatus Baltobacteraceae bacterium]
MIVTRQRRKPFPYKRLILPIVAIVLLVVAFTWSPSRNAMLSGPMAPAARTAGGWLGTIAAPFHFAAQNQIITDRNRQIAVLQNQLTAAQNAGTQKDKRISNLQQQLEQVQAQLASAGSAGPKPRGNSNAPPASASGTVGSAAAAPANGASPEMQRTAAYWTAMDPDNAAKVAQRLPPPYVARVLALMSPQAVGAILDALPPAYAAKLTQEHPELAH